MDDLLRLHLIGHVPLETKEGRYNRKSQEDSSRSSYEAFDHMIFC